MRGLWRVIAGLLVFLPLLAGGVYVFRAPLVGRALETGLAAAGFENPVVRVEQVSFRRLEIARLAAGRDQASPALDLRGVSVEYAPRRLIAERRADRIAVAEGRVAARLSPDGAFSIAGMTRAAERGGGEADAALPFGALSLGALRLVLDTPAGAGEARLSGAFSPEEGGAFALSGRAAALGFGEAMLTGAVVEGELALARDGAVCLAARLAGDVAAPQLALRDAALALDGQGRSWRDILAGDAGGLVFAGRIVVQSADVPVAESPLLAGLFADEERPEEMLSLAGALDIVYGPDGFSLAAAPGAPPALEGAGGRRLAVEARGGEPLFERRGASRRAALKLSLTRAPFDGALDATAVRAGDGPWRFDLSARLPAQTVAGAALDSLTVSAAGEGSAQGVAATLDVAAAVKAAAYGDWRVEDAALRGALRAAYDPQAAAFVLSGADDECVLLDRARIGFAEGRARLSEARLCPGEGLLLEAIWRKGVEATLAGRLEARAASWRLGQTRIEGAPPAVAFRAHYDPLARAATAAGSFAGGRMTLNGAILAADALGRFEAAANEEGLRATASLERARIAQTGAAPMIAPVLAAGSARLENERLSFDFAASTPAGRRLGAGEGAHDLRAGRGAARFATGRLDFTPAGLQPAALAPVLKGIVGTTTGALAGDIDFAWGPAPEDARSAAAFELFDLTFRGPGVAVSQTAGLTGKIALSSLIPLATAEPQTVSIRRIDIGALPLEDGVVRFALPGDETLRVIEAEFPWFGGRVGAYDAAASLSGGAAFIPLQANEIDLKLVLEFADVDGLSGEGRLNGVLPIRFEGGRARIEGGEFVSAGPGAVRYAGPAAESASAAGEQANVAFSILRDLRYESLRVLVDGPLDGRLNFRMTFEGSGAVPVNEQFVRAPVIYRINLDAALLDLLNQAVLSSDVRRQIELGRQSGQEARDRRE
ncbi:intermembrane phospholipid transport protein YdbH family protein [Amphiplicatus metriothermophilus]|uniref:Dicarboxylate transport n=1 Tax=Amphiplicatus metriothermophilus TaxID=1519374 RepID=A0A239PT50_9PROT|nr:YdbH domain-containing protein [Amphiplicatus metriothermophilus]MBB5519153.1 hypothetical protein [Amphiplicatus metriothermophilus]SNT73223.1 Dicarboxylate transport [Amphiplicatus metriothermophilus]